MTGASPPVPVPLRVLIVDDDPDHRLMLRRLLARAGIDDVVEAADGDEALAATAHRPDLVVLDLAMPGRSGVDVLPELHELLPGAPVVVLSNMSPTRMGAIVRRRGAVGFVEKRLRPDKLVHEILLAAALTLHAAARVSTQFPSAAASARKARRFVREAVNSPGDDILDEIELLVSELVTNAVLHASSSPRVDVVLRPETVRVEVYDDEPAMPQMRHPDADSLGGRGILLMGGIASRWGAEPFGAGKVVWFELDRLPEPA